MEDYMVLSPDSRFSIHHVTDSCEEPEISYSGVVAKCRQKGQLPPLQQLPDGHVAAAGQASPVAAEAVAALKVENCLRITW